LKETPKYKFGYLEAGDRTNVSVVERERWLALDRQILGLFQIMGNGIIDGWNLVSNDNTVFQITVTIGAGHINYVAAETTDDVILSLEPDSVNMIYAGIDVDTYYSGYTRFVSTTTVPNDDTLLYLGSVTTNPSSSTQKIASIDMSGRKALGFREALLDIVKEHRHIGGSDSPTKIDLVTDVQGFLGPGNMADLDASLILRGIIDPERIPKLDHIDDLENNGILTHAQLDTFVQLLDNVGSRLMGEISTVNLLRLILALKHAIPGIDDYLVNEFAYIPGISPDDMVDAANTTAIVDYRPSSEGGTHTITGTPAPSTTTYTKSWDSRDEFMYADRSSTVVVGDSVMVGAVEQKSFVEDFENVGDWETRVFEIGDISTSFYFDPSRGDSGRLDVGADDSDSILQLSKTFDPQDWSGYDSLVFSILCESADHGDVYFFLSDAEAGSQSSHRIVVDRNKLTYATPGTPGWMVVTVDISAYDRSKVNFVGFYLSTSSGWNTDVPFSLNVDQMYISSGSAFKPSGTASFTYGNGTPHLFSKLRWSASMPVGTSIRARTRVANVLADLPYATWSSYMTASGSSIELPVYGAQYKYIQVQVLLEASADRRWSPQLVSLMLDSVVYGGEFGFTFSSPDAWKSGSMYNVDADTVPGGITISNSSDIGSYTLGADGSVRKLNPDFVQTLAVYGVMAPKSFRQMVSGGSGFGTITSVDVLPSGAFLISDPDNDRVLEVSRDGTVTWGLSGAYSFDPLGAYPYAAPAADSTEETKRTMKAVGCYYDEYAMRLSVFFDEDLSDVYASGNLDMSKFVLSIGSKRIRLGYGNATPYLFGVDRDHSGIADLPEDRFFPSSNVLLFDIAQPDAVALSSTEDTISPYIVITNPLRNALLSSGTVQVDFAVGNTSFGTECGIRISMDGSLPIDFYDIQSYTFYDLSGAHTVSASLIDMDGNLLVGDQAETSVSFNVQSGTYTDRHLVVDYPQDNQQVTAGFIEIGFQYINATAGDKIMFSVDGGTPVSNSVSSPVTALIPASGRHTVSIYVADALGVPYPGAFATDTFHVLASRGPTSSSLTVSEDAARSYSGAGNLLSTVPLYYTRVATANIHCPVDARHSFDSSSVGDGSYDVIVAKIGVKSYPNYYVKSSPSFIDGSPVVEFRRDGQVSFSFADAEIARSRSDAMSFLGSVCKTSDDVFLVGDSSGRRAIVAKVDRNAVSASVEWEYKSDRRVSDFARYRASYAEVSYGDSGLSSSLLSVSSGTVVTWTNDSSSNIRIISGTTNPTQFAADPDLSLFGDEFDSGVLTPGQSFSYKFSDYGSYGYFVWPQIDTAEVSVSDYPVSPQDKFVVVENDPVSSSYSSRVIVLDSWGNVEWAFGDSLVRRIKDARPSGESEIIITV
jgi:plastocyanin